MRQQTLADSGFEKFRKKTRKERFLDDMEQIIPWQELCGAIEPYYPKPIAYFDRLNVTRLSWPQLLEPPGVDPRRVVWEGLGQVS